MSFYFVVTLDNLSKNVVFYKNLILKDKSFIYDFAE